MKNAARSPGLRDIRPEVLDRERFRLALDTGVKLRKPVEHKITGGLADIPRDHCNFPGETVPFEPHRNDSIVVGPDRTILIGERVVRRIILRQSPDAPAAPHIRLEQSANY